MSQLMKRTVSLFVTCLAVLVLISGCSAHSSEPQTVRHVILWTLNDDLSPERKQELINSTVSDIRQLENIVPGVLSMKVCYDGRLESSNCDFMFDFQFESEDALKSFSENPAHLEAAAKLKPYISGRTCLDILE